MLLIKYERMIKTFMRIGSAANCRAPARGGCGQGVQ